MPRRPFEAWSCAPAILLAVAATLGPRTAIASDAAAAICDPADSAQVRLRVQVQGLHSTRGSINITIYPDDAEHFLDGKYKLARRYVPAVMPVTEACFAMAAPGYYAVALFHDENDNRHLNTNFIGLPTEGYGFSNNPQLRFGPPGLERVRFAARVGDNPVEVHLNY